MGAVRTSITGIALLAAGVLVACGGKVTTGTSATGGSAGSGAIAGTGGTGAVAGDGGFGGTGAVAGSAGTGGTGAVAGDGGFGGTGAVAGTGGTGGAPTCNPADPSNTQCDACVQATCCPQWAACLADPSCGNESVCILNCVQATPGDPVVAEQKCAGQCSVLATIADTTNSLFACINQGCRAACIGPGGPASCTSSIPPGTTCDAVTFGIPTCDICMQQSCCGTLERVLFRQRLRRPARVLEHELRERDRRQRVHGAELLAVLPGRHGAERDQHLRAAELRDRMPMTRPRRSAKGNVGVALVGVVLALAVALGSYLMVERPWASSSEALLRRFSFDLSESDADRLFGVAPGKKIDVDFTRSSVVNELEITYPYTTKLRDFVLWGGRSFDPQAALRRLESIAPHRLDERGNFKTVACGPAALTFDPRVAHYHSGYIHAERLETAKRANAYWAVALYLVYGKTRPTAEQLELVNGPKLASLAQLDLRMRAGAASDGGLAKLTSSTCSVTPFKDEKLVSCAIDVDDPLVDKLTLKWFDSASDGASIESAAFAFHRPRASGTVDSHVGACIDHAIADGRSPSKTRWQLDSAGDSVALYEHELVIKAPDDRTKDAPPPWAEYFPAIVKALATCSR